MALKKSDVNYVYQNYLGRDPDEGAIQDLVGQEINRAQLAETILNSDEYRSLTPQDQITRQYQNVLGRGPSDDELQRVMGMDDYFNYSSTTMGSREPSQRLDFTPSVLRNDLMKLPEANLVRVFKNYLGRLPDEEAYRNYLTQFEAEPPKGPDQMGQKSRREQKLVDTNYDFAMDPKRIEEVGWSPEAQEYINSKFEAEARAYAAEKGIELPDDFSSLAQLRNPYQDNRAGMEGLNLMNPISFNEGQYYPADSVADYDVHSGADVYDLPTYAMWFSKAGTAAFTDEEKAQQMVERYGPRAAVDAYAQNPGEFVKDAATGVYVNNWLEQNIDPDVTASGANKDKLAALGQKYQDISNRAIELGANPDDIARATAQKVDKVAGDYQTYYNDMHENTFMKFLLATGGLLLGAYGLSQVLGTAGAAGGAGAGAGATAATTTGTGGGFIGGGYGSVGVSAAPAYASTAIPTNIFSNATFPGMPVGGGSSTGVAGGGLKFPGSMLPSKVPGATESFASGVGNIKVPVTQGLAPKVGSKVGAGLDAIGKGSVGLQAPSWYLPNTPTGGTSLIDKAKDVLNKADSLSDIVSEDQQQRQQPQGGLSRQLSLADLFPQTNIMISPEKWAEMTTPRRTFVGGLSAMRDMT